MVYKVCKRCGKELPITDFYGHPQMGDGHLNICKECIKADMRERYSEKTKDESFVEKERVRGREKYRRLGYANRLTEACLKKREKYKGIRDARDRFKFASSDYVELHHWNYNDLDRVICLDKRLHKRIHGIMEFNLELGYYFSEGKPLDTIEKHLEVIKYVCERDGFDFSEVQVLSK